MTEPQPGRHAKSPWHMPWAAWWQVLVRAWRAAGRDNIGLVAAGVAFYGFLALVPLLGAVVLSYGLVADPAVVVADVRSIMTVMPVDAAKLIGEQLMNVVKTSADKKGLGLVLALVLALYGAMNGASSIITALNIAYEEKEERSIFRFYLLVVTITVSAVGIAILSSVAIAVLGLLENLFPFAPDVLLVLGKIISYTLLVLAGAAGAATLYRYGPDRRKAKWVWITPGSLGAALLWLLLTIGFGIYVAQFGNYNATYGALGSVVVLLTWLYLSSYILLLGAELNSEMERQTVRDTTDGPPMPIGQRGAAVADQVATGTDAPKPASDVPTIGDDPKVAAPASGTGPLSRPSNASSGSLSRDYAAGRAVARAGQVTGVGKVSVAPAVIATAGLALLRRGSIGGALLLSVGGAWAWSQRPTEGSDDATGADGGTRTHTA